ncbi:MAG: enoyl-CoA hydratase/isomerase family protein [Acidobacteriota bacterium]
MSYEYRIEDNIIIFTFNHTKVSSINTETLKGLDTMIDRLNNEEDLKGLVLTGVGRYFSGGFCLNTFTSFQSAQEIVDWFKFEEEVLFKLFTCKKPVVAAINGHATAAGMIVSMACDYRLVLNNPKSKIGMTEIKIGLALTPAEGEIMRFGLDTDKNFRDVIFGGELMNPADAVSKNIFDELVESEEELLAKAKAKVVAYIDTPGRPFIMLKYLQKKQAAEYMRSFINSYDFNILVKTFTDENIINTLKFVKGALGV